jgi:DDE superfamily endonuclease
MSAPVRKPTNRPPRLWRHLKNFPARVAEVRAKLAPGTPVEVWFQDEMRVGQKNKLTYRWARKGSRPRATHDQRTQSTWLFGAVCPERGTGAAVVLPACNSEAMQLHLDEIATKVAPGAHAILILGQAGWHGSRELRVPANISMLPLPPRSPELNSQENIWQFMLQNCCRTAFSNLSTTSSITVVTPGIRSRTSHGRPCPSRDATGQSSVARCEDWYKVWLELI